MKTSIYQNLKLKMVYISILKKGPSIRAGERRLDSASLLHAAAAISIQREREKEPTTQACAPRNDSSHESPVNKFSSSCF
ncbi:unnamed protein product [Boreogadus saida]